MKKSNFLKIGIGLFLSLVIFSCSKDDASLISSEQLKKQEVVFDVNNFLPQNLSSKGLFSAKDNVEGDDGLLPDCSDKDPSTVEVTILGPDAVSTIYTLNLVTLNNKTETEVVKLTPGDYTITDFVVKAADGTVLWASPSEGSYYELLWGLTGVNLPFTVPEFDKLKVSIDVLCYKPYDYEKFGFVWFKYAVTEIHTVCFFGDVCTEFFEEWHTGTNGNPYYGQGNDGYDFPAIFSVVVKNEDGVIVNDPDKNSNASYFGKGSPLCIEYPDQVDVMDETFTFELWLAMPDGTDKLIYTGNFTDSASSEAGNATGFGGTDGVFDFVVGNCSYDGNDANMELPAYLPPCFTQGFEVDTVGWLDINSDWSGSVTRTATGVNGIPAAEGSWYAVFEGDDGGPFTRFCGYSDTWTGTWTAEVDVYLDPSWTTSQGFDYSVAANGTDGNHKRDFIFHVNKDASTGQLLVGGSNNSSNSVPREDLETINHFVVTTAGWYTFQHVFSNVAGKLSVDLNLLDSAGNILFTETRTDPSDLIPSVIGGNRYGWFTFINVTGGIAVDETTLVRP